MHTKLPKLNFPAIKLRLRRSNDEIMAWDELRKSFVVLTPEEWVRQHLVRFLIDQLAIPPQQIALEYRVVIGGQNQRADVVVIGRSGSVEIVAECKAHDIKIAQSTMDQAVRYNSVIAARYIILTNGIAHHLYAKGENNGEYTPLTSFDELRL